MVKTLTKSIRQYKKESILSPILVSLEVTLECLIPLYMMTMLNKIQVDNSLTNILKWGGILLALAAFSLVFGMLAGKYAATASAGFATNLRGDMFDKIQTFSFANIDKFSPSSLVTRLTTDITNIQTAYMMIIRVAVRSPIMLIISLVMTFTINAKLASIFLAISVVLGLLLFIIFKKAIPIFERVFKKYDKMNESVQENVKGMRVVKSYVREDYESKKFAATAQSVRMDFQRGERLIAFNTPAMQLSIWLAITLICYFGTSTIINSNEEAMTSSALSSLIVFAAQCLSSLMMLSMVMVMISIARASAERVVEVLHEESTLHNPENPVYEVETGDVEFRGVSFKYSAKAERNALQGINLKVSSGQTVGILGGTGSSKTTLVSLIPRLYDATEGEVLVGGRNVKEYDLEALRNQVSVACSSPAQSKKISAGATPTQPTTNSSPPANRLRLTTSLCLSPTATTHSSNRAAPTSRAVRNSASALRALCSKSPKSSFSTTPRPRWTPRPTPLSAPLSARKYPARPSSSSRNAWLPSRIPTSS